MRRNEKKISEIQVLEEIIRKADVCRIAFASNNIPYIVTMNFGYTGGYKPGLYFHCANEGRKLEIIRKNNYVCFEMDIEHRIFKGNKGCDWGMKYRSVVGYGNISILTEREGKIKGLNCIMEHYGGIEQYSFDDKVLERTTILYLEIKEMSGKKG